LGRKGFYHIDINFCRLGDFLKGYAHIDKALGHFELALFRSYLNAFLAAPGPATRITRAEVRKSEKYNHKVE
jgi:hypothetical protein